MVGIGETSVAFFPTDDPNIPLLDGLPIHHLAFRVDRANFKSATEMLGNEGSSLNSRIIYCAFDLFYDPDEHLIELTTYELSNHNMD